MNSEKKPAKINASEPMPASEKSAHNSFPIVGVGASAGGLEAFNQLLSHLPAETGMAFVLVQHLDPGHPSQLTALLAKTTSLRVLEIKNGMAIEPNHVYVIPPNKNLNLADRKLKLTPRGKAPVPHPVDFFFSSLAAEQQSWAIGVVLSGTGSDGTIGLKRIKSAGGITFAQDEKSAKFSGMPLHAAQDAVDFILPPEKIAQELARIGQEPYLESSGRQETAGDETAKAKDFRKILALLRHHSGVDFSQYRDTTIKRRIQKRMLVCNRRTLADYIRFLKYNSNEIGSLFDDVLISVTSFFREPELFETLKKRIFPKILKTAPKVIRLWVAASSTGQEAYSYAMTLLEFLEQKPNPPAIQIFATDISESVSIEKARRGFYGEGIEHEVSPERLRRFFTKEDGGYRISKTIRDLCVFARQDVTSDPPFSRMDLVSCRNLLIYLTPPLQRQVISAFHYALNPSGYLVLGNSETVVSNSDLFNLAERKEKIYSKKSAAIRPFGPFASQDLKARSVAGGRGGFPVPAAAPADFQKEADRFLLSRYSPAGVLINGNLEVLQFRGRTSPYLEPPTGEASFNLLKMARENLSLELATAIREVKRGKKPVRRSVRLNVHDATRKVNFEVIPVKAPGSAENCFLILFEEAEKGGASAAQPARPETSQPALQQWEKDRELKQLRTDLSAARDYLQTIVEQHDVTNEELKCANEEAFSSNEELQSTNEQLGTAKEELQATNEELTTLNEELQTHNTELHQTNSDLSNLLASVDIPILILGNDLRIRRYNPTAMELLNLKPSVIGRLIQSIEVPLAGNVLEPLLLEVIHKVAPKEIEIRDHTGRWFSLRLHPYRTDNRIEGVILALVDIDDLKRVNEKLVDYVTAIVDTVRAPLVVLDSRLKVNSANEAFFQTFQTTEAATKNCLIYELGGGQWNLPKLRRLLSEILSKKSVLKNFDVTHDFPQIGRRQMRLNARRLEQKPGMDKMILLSIEDITEWKEIEESNRWMAAIVESTTDAIIGKDLNGIIISCNQGASVLFGYQAEELVGKPVTMLIPPEHRQEEAEILGRIRRGMRIEHFETIRRRKDGSQVEVSLTISPVKDAQGKIIGASKIARDISERKRTEAKLAESYAREKAAREQAETANRAKDHFLAALSHELRTPLNPVLLVASDSANDRDLPPGVRTNFAMIRKNIELEARLIDDLLDLSRINSGKLTLQLSPLDARTILQDALKNLENELKDKLIQTVMTLRAERHEVRGDGVRLHQVFLNVLKNAVKFTPAKGKITVETAPAAEPGWLSVKITDTGIGMTPEELKNVFTAFSQGSHATQEPHRFGGLGLGLAISRQLVELHSGRLHAASEGRGKGAAFTIELPLSVDTEPKAVPAKTVPPETASQKIPKGARILLVEDHEPTRMALTKLLLRRNYEIMSAGSLAEARKIASGEKFDLLISDLGLPDGSGNELMAELRASQDLKGVALTGYGMTEDIQSSLAAGFVTHLVKPVLVQALENALANPALTTLPGRPQA
jgi:two-component system CheB/CheR fusion protein